MSAYCLLFLRNEDKGHSGSLSLSYERVLVFFSKGKRKRERTQLMERERGFKTCSPASHPLTFD